MCFEMVGEEREWNFGFSRKTRNPKMGLDLKLLNLLYLARGFRCEI